MINDDEAKKFLDALIALCQQFNIWLSHEDQHGGFLLVEDSTEGWLRDAIIKDE